MRELLLQSENLLRKRVDLGVLFLNLFCQSFKLRDSADFASCGTGLSAEAVQSAQELIAQKIEITFISAKFCHRDIYLTSGFAALTVVFVSVNESTCIGVNDSARRAACVSNFCSYVFFMPERIQKPAEPAPWGPKQGDGGGPRSPDVSRPDTKIS